MNGIRNGLEGAIVYPWFFGLAVVLWFLLDIRSVWLALAGPFNLFSGIFDIFIQPHRGFFFSRIGNFNPSLRFFKNICYYFYNPPIILDKIFTVPCLDSILKLFVQSTLHRWKFTSLSFLGFF